MSLQAPSAVPPSTTSSSVPTAPTTSSTTVDAIETPTNPSAAEIAKDVQTSSSATQIHARKLKPVHDPNEEPKSSNGICVVVLLAIVAVAVAVVWSDGLLGSTATLAAVKVSNEAVSFTTSACTQPP